MLFLLINLLFIEGPNLVKKNAEGSGRVGEKSNKSEDDVFSDAVTDFSDIGISPRLEERFENVRELDKSMEHKSVQGDLYGSGSLKVDVTAGEHLKGYIICLKVVEVTRLSF